MSSCVAALQLPKESEVPVPFLNEEAEIQRAYTEALNEERHDAEERKVQIGLGLLKSDDDVIISRSSNYEREIAIALAEDEKLKHEELMAGPNQLSQQLSKSNFIAVGPLGGQAAKPIPVPLHAPVAFSPISGTLFAWSPTNSLSPTNTERMELDELRKRNHALERDNSELIAGFTALREKHIGLMNSTRDGRERDAKTIDRLREERNKAQRQMLIVRQEVIRLGELLRMRDNNLRHQMSAIQQANIPIAEHRPSNNVHTLRATATPFSIPHA